MFVGLTLIISSSSLVKAESHYCSSSGYTVITINGVFTNEEGAADNKRLLDDRLVDIYDDEDVKVDYIHNPSRLSGLNDLWDSTIQKVMDDVAVEDYDLIEILRDASEKIRTQKVLLVSHSQGNFYANSFYDVVTGGSGGIPSESIGIYGVASPAGRVAGDGMWITSETDKIIAGAVAKFPLKEIMPPNTRIELQEGDDFLGHNFSGVYLKYEGRRIVDEIKNSLGKLSADVNLNTNRRCINSPEITLRHEFIGAAMDGANLVVAPIVKTTMLTATSFYNVSAATIAVTDKAAVAAASGIKTAYQATATLVASVAEAVNDIDGLIMGALSKSLDRSTLLASLTLFVAGSTDKNGTEADVVQPQTQTETENTENSDSTLLAVVPAQEISQADLIVLKHQLDELQAQIDAFKLRLAEEARAAEVVAAQASVAVASLPTPVVYVGGGGSSGGAGDSYAINTDSSQSAPIVASAPVTIESSGNEGGGENNQNEPTAESPAGELVAEDTQAEESMSEEQSGDAEEGSEPVSESAGGHLVISEIQSGGVNNGDEFIEIYNPSSVDVALSGWSIQYVGGTAAAIEAVNVTIKNFSSDDIVRAKSFFLIARGLNDAEGDYQARLDFCRADAACISAPETDGYLGQTNPDLFHRTFQLSGTANGGNIFLVNGTEAITVLDDPSIVDSVSYGDPELAGVTKALRPGDNQSIERKAMLNGTCVLPFLEGELLGNGCDTGDNVNNFVLNVSPGPQNSLSAAEPVEPDAVPLEETEPVEVLPPVQNFSLSYDQAKLELVFSWDLFADPADAEAVVTHKIKNTMTGEQVFETTSVTTFRKRIFEVGRNYVYSITALDASGTELASSEKTLAVGSFINDVSFYSGDHFRLDRTTRIDNLVEFSFDDYPFLPMDLVLNGGGTGASANYKVAVFYLNKDAPQHEFLFTSHPQDEDLNDVLRLEYETCAGGNGYNSSLLLPDNESYCNVNGGFGNGSMKYPTYLADVDNHLLLPVKRGVSADGFSTSDYFTVAFYGFYRNYPWGFSVENGGANNFKLLAVDKMHYGFQDGMPEHSAPAAISGLNFSFDPVKMLLTASLDVPRDADSLDQLLRYEVSYDNGLTWSATQPSFRLLVEPNATYPFQVRVKDDFGILSDVWSGSYTVPDVASPPFGIPNLRWGNIEGTLSISFDYFSYPFMPDDGSSYNAMVFYLNRLPPLAYAFNAVEDSSYSQVGVAYQSCSDSAIFDRWKLILARYDLSPCPTWSGAVLTSALYPTPSSAPGNITLPIRKLYNVDKSIGDLSSDDYITIGFYRIDGIGVYNQGNMGQVAHDTHHYHFVP